MNSQVSIPKDRIAEFCRRRGICLLSIFGSALRDDFRPDSDIDVLFEFESDQTSGLLEVASMEQELAQILGREVDMVERSAVERSRNYIRRDAILQFAETVYAA